MKRQTVISIAFLLLLCTSVSAQTGRVRDADYFPRSEIYLQYGTPSVVELTTILNSEYRSEGYDGDSRNHKFSGIAAVGYSFFLHPRVSVGLDFGYGYGSADMYITDSDMMPVDEPIFVCRSTVQSYVTHLSATYVYWQYGPMECSGSLYLGVSWQDESIVRGNEDFFIPEANDRLRFSFHITAVKFRYGETVGGFAELGFGYRGLVNVGLSIKI
ncbi:MAG TPA: hypothetical protein IAC04_02295 [Candidatus Coprenecus stercoravium]|uniref:Outer membrane protein beta-barrel domain-containing protein n=1 Tax=Candidatus Coprenecus stercoravium TaxID=2840735 RepID=A0A9D2GPP8_9BACT|nr:hypothetical protein [Candidatus Coprenecus stercoravium]